MPILRVVSSTEPTDLNQSEFDFGVHDDLLITKNSYGTPGAVATYEGNDIILLNDLSAHYESQVWSGSGDDTIHGGSAKDAITPGYGDDVAFGAGGNDDIYADRGNDYIDGGKGKDFVHFGWLESNAPDDGVENTIGVVCDLRASGIQDFGPFGQDILRNIENIFGGQGDDIFYGDRRPNIIEGRLGNDLIYGLGGDDTLYASADNDTLIGGKGADVIILHEYEADSRDLVVYRSRQASGTTSQTRDEINNFDPGKGAMRDRIDLSEIYDGDLVFVGESFTGAEGEVMVSSNRRGCVVWIELDGELDPDMSIFLVDIDATSIRAHDFIL